MSDIKNIFLKYYAFPDTHLYTPTDPLRLLDGCEQNLSNMQAAMFLHQCLLT